MAWWRVAIALVPAIGCGANVVLEPSDPNPDGERWCDSQKAHDFCADFDGDDPEAGWDTSGAGTAFEVSSDRSPPSALQVHEPPISDVRSPIGYELSKLLDMAAPAATRVAFDLRVDEIGADDEVDAMNVARLAFVFRSGDGMLYHLQTGLWVGRKETRLSLVVACGYSSPPPPPCVDHEPPPGSDDGDLWSVVTDIPRSRWVRVEMSLDIASYPAIATVTFDGAAAGSLSTQLADPHTADGVELSIGAVNPQFAHPGPFEASFDSLVLDID